MKPLLTCTLILIMMPALLQAQKRVFRNNSDVMKVRKGDLIEIEADSAFVLSGNRADYLNQRLNELDTIRRIYEGMGLQKEELIRQVDELSSLISNLKTDMVQDSIRIRNELGVVIQDLHAITADLKQNNLELRQNNEDLNVRIERLNTVIKELKREMRWIWWNGLTDKIVVFAAGVGVGAVLVLLL
jgi:hypothetical protein